MEETLDIKIDEEKNEEEKQSKVKLFLKKTYILLIALFLIFLLTINSGPGYHIISLLSGKVVSSTLNEDYTFTLKNGKNVFFGKTFEILRETYRNNKDNEFKVCLTGEVKDGNYYVENIYVPKIIEQTPLSVTSSFCNEQTIISLHSHPPFRCIFSEQDIKSYNIFKQRNSQAIIGLLCEEERITFYGY